MKCKVCGKPERDEELKPCPENHLLCKRVENLEGSQLLINSNYRERIALLERTMGEIATILDPGHRRNIIGRTKFRIGRLAHRLGEYLQMDEDE